MEASSGEPELERPYQMTGWTLLAGLLGSIAVMVIGLVRASLTSRHGVSSVVPLADLTSRLRQGAPSAPLDLGILLLFATPLVGVIAAAIEFWRRGETPFVSVAVFLLFVLLVSFAVALH